MFIYLKFLHVGTMFVAVGITVGSEWLLHRVAGSGDVKTIRTVFAAAQPLNWLIPLLFVVGGILGFATAGDGHFSLLTGWQITAFIIFVLALAVGGGITGRWLQKVGVMSASHSDGTPSPELDRLLHDRNAALGSWLIVIMVLAIVYFMVVKPF